MVVFVQEHPLRLAAVNVNAILPEEEGEVELSWKSKRAIKAVVEWRYNKVARRRCYVLTVSLVPEVFVFLLWAPDAILEVQHDRIRGEVRLKV